jgi:hypothetical protein
MRNGWREPERHGAMLKMLCLCDVSVRMCCGLRRGEGNKAGIQTREASASSKSLILHEPSIFAQPCSECLVHTLPDPYPNRSTLILMSSSLSSHFTGPRCDNPHGLGELVIIDLEAHCSSFAVN